MNIKIWIGNNNNLRKKVLSMIDINSFGGESYFRNCTSVYIYHKPKFDVRANSHEIDREKGFNTHSNKEIIIK